MIGVQQLKRSSSRTAAKCSSAGTATHVQQLTRSSSRAAGQAPLLKHSSSDTAAQAQQLRHGLAMAAQVLQLRRSGGSACLLLAPFGEGGHRLVQQPSERDHLARPKSNQKVLLPIAVDISDRGRTMHLPRTAK